MDTAEEIIREHCGDLEQRVRACSSREVAECLARVLVRELGTFAERTDVREYLRVRLEVLSQKIFDAEGRNRFLNRT